MTPTISWFTLDYGLRPNDSFTNSQGLRPNDSSTNKILVGVQVRDFLRGRI